MSFLSFLGFRKKRESDPVKCDRQQLTDDEVAFLSLLEGKRANDSSVLGWWCACKHIDRTKTLDMLFRDQYITTSDYRYNIKKSTIPVLKTFLKTKGLDVKGKKDDLINRIIENIPEPDCASHFTQSFYILAENALDVLRRKKIRDDEKYNESLQLIRKGRYAELRKKFYPNEKEHWGTEDTFLDTIDFAVKYGFEQFGLREDIRVNVAAFIALRAVDYSSRGYSHCREKISECLSTFRIGITNLGMPTSLEKYAKDNEIEKLDDVFDLYIQFAVNRARAAAELNNYRRLGIREIKITGAKDCRTCKDCLSKSSKPHRIDKAPLLPLCWDCRCFYSPIMDGKIGSH